MVTLEDAREIAAGWMKDISGCTEFTTAYAFYNPRTENSISSVLSCPSRVRTWR